VLTLSNIGIEFGGKWLFKNATYQFKPGERVGLIGRNGAGKSTLLKAIYGKISPSEGEVVKAGKLNIGYFHQDLLSYETERSIFEVAREAFTPQLELKAEIDALLVRMEAGEADQDLWDELANKQDLFEAQGGTQIDATVHSVLAGLGFSPETQEQPYKTLSGGWRMRVLLARMLLTEPDVLMLDEPTNHLDLPSIQWLEQYLKSFKGSTIVVSHDRFFIDRVSNKILEISLKQLNEYTGNYTFYLTEKAERMALHQRAYDNQQKYIQDQEKFINRFRAKATKARQAQSKLKQLEKIDRLEAPEEEVVDLSIRFSIQKTSGKEVLRLKEISKAYGENVILADTSATVMRGDKIALIGPNGMGKSTLLRIMAEIEPHQGIRELGHQVEESFFAQHQLEALNLKATILEEAQGHIRDKTEQEIRTILGCFMFSGEDVDKRITVLSGGEKSRVALAKTLMSEANFLLLDEPTNHLDIPSIQILVDAMNAYEGTYVVVSHDRYFLQKVANKIWYIEDHKVKEYPGTYDEYVAWVERKLAQQKNEEPVPSQEVTDKVEQDAGAKPASTLSFAEQKQLKNRLKKLSRQQEKLEAKLMELEEEAEAKMEEMGSPEVATDFTKLTEVQTAYDALQAQIESVTEEWEAVITEMEELEG